MKKDRLYVAFSKKKKTIIDYGIAGWTVGQYVHVELVLNGESYSSSAPDGVEYNKNQLTYLRKRYTELKTAKIDAKELGMDTTDIDTEIAELKTKVIVTQAKLKGVV